MMMRLMPFADAVLVDLLAQPHHENRAGSHDENLRSQ